MNKLNSIIDKALSRRTFLAGAGSVAAAGLLAGCSDNGTVTLPASGSYSDTDVLNFALNLEYLEASFYLYAATGKGLAASDMTAGSASPYQTAGTVTTGNAGLVAGTSGPQQEIINEIAYEEQQHVRFLRAALGSAAVPMPDIDLSFFSKLATAANIPNGSSFNPFSSFDYFLVGAFIFEDVGVTAYAGAAPLISAAGVTAGYLTAASGILAVEAYHAAYVRTALTANAIAGGMGSGDPYVSAANLVADLRASLTIGNSGAPGTATGNNGQAGSSSSVEVPLAVPTSLTTPSSIVACDHTYSIGFARSVNQVLHIVYGQPAGVIKSGGFFPSGMNSIFATTTA